MFTKIKSKEKKKKKARRNKQKLYLVACDCPLRKRLFPKAGWSNISESIKVTFST